MTTNLQQKPITAAKAVLAEAERKAVYLKTITDSSAKAEAENAEVIKESRALVQMLEKNQNADISLTGSYIIRLRSNVAGHVSKLVVTINQMMREI